jgi:hypothetical protein
MITRIAIGLVCSLVFVIPANQAFSLTLNVTEGTMSTGPSDDFSLRMNIRGENFSITAGPPSGPILDVPNLRLPLTPGASVNFSGAVPLVGPATILELSNIRYLLSGRFDFTAGNAILPTVQFSPCPPTFPICTPTPINTQATVSAPLFALVGQLVARNSVTAEQLNITLLAAGSVDAEFRLFAPPSQSPLWNPDHISFSLSTPVPEPSTALLLLTGLIAWSLKVSFYRMSRTDRVNPPFLRMVRLTSDRIIHAAFITSFNKTWSRSLRETKYVGN